MEKLVSSWYNDQSLPDSYMFPPEARPGKLLFPRCNNVPVVDISKALDHNRTDTVQQILKASQEFGFFQVCKMFKRKKKGYEFLEYQLLLV